MEVTEADTTAPVARATGRFRWNFKISLTTVERDGSTREIHPFLNNDNSQDLLFLRILMVLPPYAAKRGKETTQMWSRIMDAVRKTPQATTQHEERNSISTMSIDAAKKRYSSYLTLETSFHKSGPKTGDTEIDKLLEQPAGETESILNDSQLPVVLQIYKSIHELINGYHKAVDEQEKEKEQVTQKTIQANTEIVELTQAAIGNKQRGSAKKPAKTSTTVTDMVIEVNEEDPSLPTSISATSTGPTPKKTKRSGASTPTSDVTMQADSFLVTAVAERAKRKEENKTLRNQRKILQLQNEQAKIEAERVLHDRMMTVMENATKAMMVMTNQIQASQRSEQDQPEHQDKTT